jgi:hypothetical protein
MGDPACRRGAAGQFGLGFMDGFGARRRTVVHHPLSLRVGGMAKHAAGSLSVL